MTHMSISLQLGRCFTAVLSSSSSSPSSSYQCRVATLRIACCSRSVSVQEALPSQIVPPLPSTSMPPPPPPTATSDGEEHVGNAAQDLSGGSGIRVTKQRHISVSKSELLDAITAAMFPSLEEARQFLSLSQCLDLILHAEHKTILEEMRADFDLVLSGKSNTCSLDDTQSVGRKVVVNQESDTFKNSSPKSTNFNDKEQNNGDEVSTSSDFTQDFKQFLDFSWEISKRSLIKSSRVLIPSRFQRAFMKLLYNAEFEELSPRDLRLASTLNTDYLLTLPIYVDWKKAFESSTIIFRRGYATEREKGLLIGQKLDYLQSKLLQRFFFPLIGKPLGKLFVWLNEVFGNIKKQNPGILENKVMLWLKDVFLSLKPQSYDEQIVYNLTRYDILSKEFPIWVAAQKAVTQYESVLKVAGPREKLFKKFLAWIGLVPSTTEQANDFDLDSAGSELNLSSSFLSRISLSDIWKPASPKSCGNDFKKMLGTAFSILVSPSILQEPAFQELILLYTKEVGGKEIADQDDLASLQMKIYERIPIPDLPVVFPHKKLSFRILDTVRLDAATILGLLAYFFSYKFENIASSPSAIILDVIAATALVIYVFRVVLGYKLTRDRYQLLVNRTLYEKTVASGFGSIHFLLDASEQQLFKEAILAYATLLKSENSQERSTRAIGEKCEEFMHNTFQEQIEMPIEKAVETLVRLGLVVSVMNTEAVAVDLQQEQQAVPCSTATLILRNRWNALIN